MSLAMTPGRIVELAVAVLAAGAGIYFYRRRENSDPYGSQGAVILFVVAAVMGIHALGGLDYHPSNGELEAMKDRGR